MEVNGVPMGTHGVARDITHERARDERIRLLATALESLDEGVSIVDAEGRFVYANSAHARLYRYQPDQLSELRATQLLAGIEPEKEHRALLDLLRETGTWSGRST